MKVSFLAGVLCLIGIACAIQARPRLVVVISYDQLRGDFPARWAKNFSDKGFNLLKNEGAVFANTYFGHAKNITGPGHSVLLTGCNPAKTGITGNNFIEDSCNCLRYCAAGEPASEHGAASTMRSPALLAVPTLGEILLKKFPKSRTVGVALKDRAAVLMAGKQPRTVLWFEPSAGGFTTSAYYDAPRWLESFNRRHNARKAAGWQWQATLPDGAPDDVEFEGNFPGGRRTFPHRIPNSTADSNFWEAFLCSPKSIELLFEAAKSAVIEEELGADDQPDVLCIGVSTTDFIGHLFGPDSRETEELYPHCDRILGDFIAFLDRRLGREQYVLTVTSDHGVAPIPEVARQYGPVPLDAGRIPSAVPIKAIRQRFDSLYGARASNDPWVRFFEPPTIFLNTNAMAATGINPSEGAAEARNALKTIPGVGYLATTEELAAGATPDGWPPEFARLMRNDIFPGRSGHIVVFPKQYWLFGSKATTHGTFYDYDRFVPMMFLGGEIQQKHLDISADPADIAPTLAALLGVEMPDPDGIARAEIFRAIPKKKGRKQR